MMGVEGLFHRFPKPGRVEWIGVRPARREPLALPAEVLAVEGGGLVGDHYGGGSGARGVTLIQAEHLAVVADLMGLETLDPGWLRRNLVVSGINLSALKRCRFQVGEAVLEGTRPCQPCSRMEEALGFGGLTAMHGHGGLNARVLRGGRIRLGDDVRFLDEGEPPPCDLP